MGSYLDAVLNESIRNHLDSFFISLQGDSTALTNFLGAFSTFNNTIQTQSDSLQEETLVAVRNFASVVDTVALNILELEVVSDKIRDDIVSDVSRILDKKMDNLTISDGVDEVPGFSKDTYPAYIKVAYDWLLSNLHNPYPSKEVKKDISRQTKCSVKDIDAWFIDVRKRIGWNKLRRTHFGNKQERIIDAASYIFNPAPMSFKDDLSGDLASETPSYDYRAEFTIMEDAARSLYSGRFVDTPSLTALLNSVKESPSVVAGTSTKRKGGHKRARSSEVNRAFSYPTPEPSPGQIIEPSPPSTPIAIPDQLPTLSRKRRQSSSDAEEIQARPQKRSRLDTHESTEIAAVASLPSPANTTDFSEDTTEECQSPTEPTASPESAAAEEAPRTKRKRRLSDGDDHRPTKRPHNALVVPRLQTVSDPFPIAKSLEGDSFNEWLQSLQGNFTAEPRLSHAIPSPTNLEDPVFLDAVPLDIHFHQYDFSPYQPEIPLLEEPLTGHESVTPGASPSSSGVSKSTENLEKTIGYESLSLSDDLLQGVDLTNFSFNLDYESLDTLRTPFSGTDLQTCDTVDILNFDAFNQSTPSNFWTSDLASPLVDAYDVESFSSYNAKTPVFGNFNAIVRQDFPRTEDQAAKLARAELLREELRRLEADIAA